MSEGNHHGNPQELLHHSDGSLWARIVVIAAWVVLSFVPSSSHLAKGLTLAFALILAGIEIHAHRARRRHTAQMQANIGRNLSHFKLLLQNVLSPFAVLVLELTPRKARLEVKRLRLQADFAEQLDSSSPTADYSDLSESLRNIADEIENSIIDDEGEGLGAIS